MKTYNNERLTIKPYMVYEGNPEEGALLVFANTAREAKKIGYQAVRCWNDEAEFINIRVKKLTREIEYLYSLADQISLEENIPHVNDTPPCCIDCETWGDPLDKNGRCADCAQDKEEVYCG